jgi:hypothetical protein
MEVREPPLVAALHELRGKQLICCYAPERCHMEMLIELAKSVNPDIARARIIAGAPLLACQIRAKRSAAKSLRRPPTASLSLTLSRHIFHASRLKRGRFRQGAVFDHSLHAPFALIFFLARDTAVSPARPQRKGRQNHGTA